jgi:uncharacterized protein Yka (UPF0111/DUF47 family)
MENWRQFMNYLNERVAYIKGLVEGLSMTEGNSQNKVLAEIANLLEDVVDAITELEEAQGEMDDLMTEMDEELSEIAEKVSDTDDFKD